MNADVISKQMACVTQLNVIEQLK